MAATFPWDRYKTVIDIGCAEGCVPVQVALAHEHMSGGGFDLPQIEPLFDEYVAAAGLSDRLTFQTGRLLRRRAADRRRPGDGQDPPRLGPRREAARCCEKAYKALPDGGALIVYEAIIDDDRRENAFGLLMSLNMLIETPGGFDFTGRRLPGLDGRRRVQRDRGQAPRRAHLDGGRVQVAHAVCTSKVIRAR